MSSERPVNLNLFTIRFPVTAIVSILHRISGVVLFLMIPVLLWLLNVTLSSPVGFVNVQTVFQSHWVKCVVLGMAAALVYHVFAGIRHLLMDMNIGDSFAVGKVTSYVVIVLTLCVVVYFGFQIW